MVFPALNEAEHARPQTRNTHYLPHSREFTFDSDPDDLAEEYLNDNELPLNYKLVSVVLLLNYYKHSEEYSHTWERIDSYLKKSLEEIINSNDDMKTKFTEGEFSYNDLIGGIINNAINLYTEFVFNIPMANTKREKEINLYSGLSASKLIIVENLEKLSSDQSYFLPTFISSSLSRDTALRFTDANYRVMIHLKIPESKLDVFPYRPLFKKDVEFPLSLESTVEELELLLPPYCEVIFKGKKQGNISFYRYVVENGFTVRRQHPEVNVVIYELEFVSFCEESKYGERVCNKSPKDLKKECIKNLLDPPKKVLGKHGVSANTDPLAPKGRGGTKRRKKKKIKKSKRKKKNKPKYKNKKTKTLV